jgi:hypothetical protein
MQLSAAVRLTRARRDSICCCNSIAIPVHAYSCSTKGTRRARRSWVWAVSTTTCEAKSWSTGLRRRGGSQPLAVPAPRPRLRLLHLRHAFLRQTCRASVPGSAPACSCARSSRSRAWRSCRPAAACINSPTCARPRSAGGSHGRRPQPRRHRPVLARPVVARLRGAAAGVRRHVGAHRNLEGNDAPPALLRSGKPARQRTAGASKMTKPPEGRIEHLDPVALSSRVNEARGEGVASSGNAVNVDTKLRSMQPPK